MSLSNLPFAPVIKRSLKKVTVKCGLDPCQNQQLMRGIPVTRQGIRVGQVWYCGVDCFVQAASQVYNRISNRRVVEIPRAPRLPLGLALLLKGCVTAERLRWAAEQSVWQGESLETALLRLGLTTEKQLAVARSAQWGYPVLAQEHIGHMVQAELPRTILEECSSVPFHYSRAAKRILLGFAHCIDHSLLESVEHITGCRVEPCFVTHMDLIEQLERLTCAADYNEILIGDPCTPEEMAFTAGQLAVEAAAREASFTHCRNHAWTRLTGKWGVVDVIFRMKNAAPEEALGKTDYGDEAASSFG